MVFVPHAKPTKEPYKPWPQFTEAPKQQPEPIPASVPAEKLSGGWQLPFPRKSLGLQVGMHNRLL